MSGVGRVCGGAGASVLGALALLLAVAPSAIASDTAGDRGDRGPMLGVVSQAERISTGEIGRMRRAGVETLRFLVPWGRIEAGAPGRYSWRLIDERLLAASESGAVTTATVFGSPPRFGARTPPTDSAEEMAAWLGFLRALVERYGPGGRFIDTHPGVAPIRRWQAWNEPNLSAFWGDLTPSPNAYVRLLDRSAEALRAADPGATVIAAGLSPAARGIDPGVFLRRMYARWAELGAEPSFDELALHPYADSVEETRRLISQALRIARRAGHPRPPTTIAEVGWGSAGPRGYPLAGTARSQVRKLKRAYAMFDRKAAAWNLSAIYWYALRDLPADVDACGFCEFTGLLDERGRPKPAWKAFRKVLGGEG